jgi:hypothetical protein
VSFRVWTQMCFLMGEGALSFDVSSVPLLSLAISRHILPSISSATLPQGQKGPPMAWTSALSAG